jgi:hypothetical protein
MSRQSRVEHLTSYGADEAWGNELEGMNIENADAAAAADGTVAAEDPGPTIAQPPGEQTEEIPPAAAVGEPTGPGRELDTLSAQPASPGGMMLARLLGMPHDLAGARRALQAAHLALALDAAHDAATPLFAGELASPSAVERAIEELERVLHLGGGRS